MSPHPSITAAPQPLLPRQTVDPNDPYGISSMMASLSAAYLELYSDYSYSSYSYDADYYSSLMSEYASLTAAYSLTGYTYPTYTATGAGTVRGSAATSTGASRATTVPASSPDSNVNGGGSGGLSSGAKIGIGVGVTLGCLLLAGIGIVIWCMGKRKGKKTSTTVIVPAQPAPATQQQQPPPQQFQPPQPQMGYANNQGYMPGYPQTMSPPPQYQQPPQSIQQQNMAGAYGAYAKGPDSNVVELEQEYHFAKPGVVEMDDGKPEPEQPQKRK